jgi:hypothetical protein
MFTLGSSSPGGDRDPGEFRVGSAVNYGSIYSNRERAASYFPLAAPESPPVRPANHGFRHPDNAGFQPRYGDLAWSLVTDFLPRRG